jgi:hypothetical protein
MVESQQSRRLASLIEASTAEDRWTELLALALTAPECRAAFVQQCLGADIACDDLLITTQHANVHGQGYPDMRITAGNLFALVENKLGAILQPSQTRDYPREVAKQVVPHRVLAYQVPHARLPAVHKEAWSRLGLDHGVGHSAALDGIRVVIFSWETTVAVLTATSPADPVARLACEALALLAPTICTIAAQPLHQGDVMLLSSHEVIEAMFKLQTVVAAVPGVAKKNGFRSKTISSSLEFQGINLLHLASQRTIWVGLMPQAGMQWREGPLWLQVTDMEHNAPALAAIQAHGYCPRRAADARPSWSGVLVALPLPDSGATTDEQAAQILKGISGICGILAAT